MWNNFPFRKVFVVFSLVTLQVGVAVIPSEEKNHLEPVVPKGTASIAETDDAVIVEAEPRASRDLEKRHSRIGRQTTWAEALGEGSPCLTSRGVLGSCTTFRHCYPYIKLPNIGLWESWVLGNYDTCTYFGTYGVQTFGVCCTNPIPTISQDEENVSTGEEEPIKDDKCEQSQEGVNNVEQEKSANSVSSSSVSKDSKYQNWPPPIPTHPPKQTTIAPYGNYTILQWPPSIPTHPPDHHYPTHPPQMASDVPHTTLSTKRPTSRPPTYPIWIIRPETTTKKPTAYPPWTSTTTTTRKPYPSWPPPIPTHPPSTSTTAPTTSSTWSPSEVTHRPDESFQASCGAKNGAIDQERIVGGQNASPNEWPWVVVLFNGGRQFCGGSLIDSVHILTAAHCVAHMTSWDVARLTVNLGDHNIRTSTEVRHVERKIKRVIRHKGFSFQTLYNDIAILTMDKPVEFTKTIRPICLPTVSTKAYNGKVGIVAGWGSLRENGPQPSVLQKVQVPIWSNQQCAQKYGSAAPAGITSAMICAGQAQKDSCSGDSGGPLMVSDGKWELLGIVSWGIGCGKGQYPGVYTRVPSFMPWISKNLNM